MSPLCFYPAIPLLDIYLVEHPSDLEKVKRLKGAPLNIEMGGAIAKTCCLDNHNTGERIIAVCYPDMFKDEACQVMATLVHEAVHCWNYTKELYGYGDDNELGAYAIENIYKGLFDLYAVAKKKEANHAKRT
jgi:hypothetical protein